MRKRCNRVVRPLVNTLNALTRLTPAEVMAEELALLSSLESVSRGRHPGRQEWDSLADVVNIIETVTVQGLLCVSAALIRAAETGMHAAATRYREGGPLRLSGKALRAMRVLVATWVECLRTWSRRAVTKARHDTAERIRRGLLSGECVVVEVPL